MKITALAAALAFTACEAAATEYAVHDGFEVNGEEFAYPQVYYTDTYASQTWYRTIPVCFNSTTTALPNFNALRAQLMNAVARTWTQATGLRFTGWGQCPQPGTPKTINVGVNTVNVGCNAAKTCTPSDGCTDRIDINVCPPAWNDVTLIHEFGHALGFAHEMDRPDFPDYGSCSEDNQSGGDYLHTIPDQHSIMNGTYCHMNPELSYFDISGSQNLWGRQNFFADVTGDGLADAIVVNPDGVWVRVTDSSGKMPASSQRNWTGDGFWGWKGTHFADVNGDGRADLIAVDDAGIAVRLSTGTSFGPATYWTSGPYWGERGSYFADVTGDGRADAIVVNNDGVFVSISNGSTFVRDKYWLTTVPNDREPKNYFADVTGPDDGKRRADLIAINTDGIVVCPALVGGGFGTCVNWTGNTAFWGTRGTLFADYDGDGRDDAIAFYSSDGTYSDVHVGISTGSSFHAATWQIAGLRIERGVHFANVNSSSQQELITVNDDGVWGLGTIPSFSFYNATEEAFYGLR